MIFKQFLKSIACLLSLSMLPGIAHAKDIRASDPAILPQGQAVLNYLEDLSSAAPGHGILSGQWVNGPQDMSEYAMCFQKLYEVSGRYPAILGADYTVRGFSKTPRSTPPVAPLDKANDMTRKLIAHWQAGGLVSLTTLFDNPWYRMGVGRSCSDVPKPCVPGKLADLLDPQNPAGAYYKAQLDQLAIYLQQLQDAKVIVLLRAFNEMNGSWFWWGAQGASEPSQEDFRKFWVYTHDYLTHDKHLHNLLWLYAPNNSEKQLELFAHGAGLIQPAPYYYPGGAYVDLTGLSYYQDHLAAVPTGPTKKPASFSIPTYNAMISLGKPFGFGELGPASRDKQTFSFREIVHEAARIYPKIVFFTAWQDHPYSNTYLSIVANPNAKEFMNDPLVITRDKLKTNGQ